MQSNEYRGTGLRAPTAEEMAAAQMASRGTVEYSTNNPPLESSASLRPTSQQISTWTIGSTAEMSDSCYESEYSACYGGDVKHLNPTPVDAYYSDDGATCDENDGNAENHAYKIWNDEVGEDDEHKNEAQEASNGLRIPSPSELRTAQCSARTRTRRGKARSLPWKSPSKYNPSTPFPRRFTRTDTPAMIVPPR